MPDIERPEYPDMVNTVAFVGDNGYSTFEGPFPFNMEGGVWSIRIPTDPDDYASLKTPMHNRLVKDQEGNYAVAIADCEVVAGGKCTAAYEPEGEGEIHVAVDTAPSSDVTG